MLTSHASKCTQNWNHAMRISAIGHAELEDSARNGSDGHGVFWKATSRTCAETRSTPALCAAFLLFLVYMGVTGCCQGFSLAPVGPLPLLMLTSHNTNSQWKSLLRAKPLLSF